MLWVNLGWAQVAPTCGSVILTGDDADDHGNQATYAALFDNILSNVTNGGSGILAIGADPATSASAWITTVAGLMSTPQAVTFANDAAISTQSLAGFAIIHIPSDIFDTFGGISQSENDLLVARAVDIAAFVSGGGGLFGNTQGQLTNAYGYLGSVGSFSVISVPPSGVCSGSELFDNIASTAEGIALGITSSNLDHCCFHNVFTTFPAFLNVLATADEPNCSSINGQATIIGGTAVCPSINCPKTQGYWKNHPDAWPTGATPMLLGTNSYTKTQLLTILNTAPGTGGSADACLILAHQLITAKLNIANGSPAPAPVPATIVAADGAIGSGAVPCSPKVKPSSTLGQTMTSLAAILDSYNNNILTPNCGLLKGATRPEQPSPRNIPVGFALDQNFPNPFNPETQIGYGLPEAVHARLVVYDVLGREVKVLVDAVQPAGSYSVVWDGKDRNGSTVTSGVYFYRLTAGSFTSMQRMLLLK